MGVLARISGKTAVVVDDSESCRRTGAPAPQDEIESAARGAAREGADEQRRIAFGDESSRELLGAEFAMGDHLVAPAGGGEIVVGHAEGRERPGVPGVEDGSNIGVVGDKRGRLQRADLIGLTQRGHRRERSVKRRHSLRIEAASVEFRAAAEQGLTGVNWIEGAIKQAGVTVHRLQA